MFLIYIITHAKLYITNIPHVHNLAKYFEHNH